MGFSLARAALIAVLGLSALATVYLILAAARGAGWGVARAEEDATAEVTLSPTSIGAINPQIYGVNYVWHLVPSTDFESFARAMLEIGGTALVRYPGGWAAESYDWDLNTYHSSPGENAANRNLDEDVVAEHPGVDPETFLRRIPSASFVTPSAPAIRDPAQIPATADLAASLVARYGSQVKVWEIGNEWWLQRGAKQNPEIREENLRRYAALVAQAAPAMKSADPAIELYVTGEWTHPDDFSQLRRLVGERAWRAVDGASIHPYCGDLDPDVRCSLLPQRAERIRALTGRDSVFASEWSLGSKVTQDNFGIRDASKMISAVQALAQARIRAATYWPAVRGVPAVALVSSDYDRIFASGVLFSWMARYYQGTALATSGTLASAAARSSEGVTVFVATMDGHYSAIRIPLADTGLSRVVSAELMSSDDPDNPDRSRIVRVRPLVTRTFVRPDGVKVAEGDLDTPGQARGWEIARITLR